MSFNHDSEYIPSDDDYDDVQKKKKDDDYDGDDMECSNSYASDDSSDGTYDEKIIDVTCEPKSYIILKEDDLIQRQQDEINKVTSIILSISNDDALMLLLKYKWHVTNIYEAWFGDEVKVRESIGMLDVDHDVKFPKKSTRKVGCGICFDSVMVKDTANCGCGHVFCKECWISYVSTAINDGPGCLCLKCPEPSCGAAVGPNMVKVLVGGKEKKKYDRFWLGSYVEYNEKIKWCPGPGCDYAAEFDDKRNPKYYDVTCDCKYVFCWKCTDDAHSPLDCETVGKWVLKNTAEAENTNWILAYTKPCPQCKKSIEKNAGCMHMSCRCGHHFCWLCLVPLERHNGTACNRYREADEVSKGEQKRELAKRSIERYTHYYERWAANEKSRKQALSDLHMNQTRIKTLCMDDGEKVNALQFIIEAWLQIVECRRVLKWTYAYGYYIPTYEEAIAKKEFYEYLQGQAENALERLHYCAEKEASTYIETREKEAATNEDVHILKKKLIDLTVGAGNVFKNLVRALENDLSEIEDYDLSCQWVFFDT